MCVSVLVSGCVCISVSSSMAVGQAIALAEQLKIYVKFEEFINPFTATLPRMLTLPAPSIFTVSTLRSGYYL